MFRAKVHRAVRVSRNADATPADPVTGPAPSSFRSRVYAMVRRVPPGRVTSYGDVAALVGSPRAARGVGASLNALSPDDDVPWWRVVNGSGRLTIPPHFGLRTLQRTLLEEEGVVFGPTDAIDLDRFGWEGPADVLDPDLVGRPTP